MGKPGKDVARCSDTAQKPRSNAATPPRSASLVQARAEFLQYNSHLPPPEVMAHYEVILPGATDRFLRVVEKQSDHRMALEADVVRSDIKRSNAGLIAGFIIGLASVAMGGFLVWSGHDLAGATFVGVPMASLVGTFVYGTNSRRKERESKAKLMAGLQEGEHPRDEE